MKVLVIEYRDLSHPEAGGAEVVLSEILSRLAAQGIRIDYLCNRHGRAPREEIVKGVRYLRHGHQAYFNWLVPLLYRTKLRRNGYDLIFEGIDKLPVLMPLFERRVPVMCLIPHLFGTSVFLEASPWLGAYVYLMEKLIPPVYRNCLISVPSQSTRDDLVARGLPVGHIRVINNGLSSENYTPPDSKQFEDHPLMLYVGRLKKYKEIELGMKALQLLIPKYPTLEYRIIGSGDYRTRLESIASTLGVSRHVTFTGFITEEAKREALKKAHVLLYTSPKEGWGISAVEANASGTLVVASNSPGLSEAVSDGKSGFLVPHGDVQAIARSVDRLLSDPPLYNTMRIEALAWARRFSWDRMARETLDLMTAACRKSSTP